jgi:predicted acyltransferase
LSNGLLATAPVKRLLSLDALRGFTIAFMIMANTYGDSGPWGQMSHADWNGFTATDLVFPIFLFVVGTSIAFAFEARLDRGATQRELAWHTMRRAGMLFLLGIFLNVFPSFDREHYRVYGILQRIALCYLIVALFYLWDRRVWSKVAVLMVVLVGYWILVRWVPVPGAGVPGRDIPFLDKNLNFPAWLDRRMFPYHLYEDATTHNLSDPEGLLSTIPAVGTTLLGLLTGQWLRMQRAVKTKTLGLVAGSVLCLFSGYLWSVWFPLNKKMWTSSFVLVAAGWSLGLFALAFWIVEQKGWCTKGLGKWLIWPWLVFGSNAITAYMVSELLLDPELFKKLHNALASQSSGPIPGVYVQDITHISHSGWGAFVHSVAYTAICFLPMWILYRKKIFLKV